MNCKTGVLLLLASFFLWPATCIATSIQVPDAIGKDGITDRWISKPGRYEQKFANVESFFWKNITVRTTANRTLIIGSSDQSKYNLDGKYNDYHLGEMSLGTPDYVQLDKQGDLVRARYDVAFGTRLQTFGEENSPFRLGVRGVFNDFNLISHGFNTASIFYDKNMMMYVLEMNMKITTLRPWADGSEPPAHAFGSVRIPLRMDMRTPTRPQPPTEVPEPMSLMLLGSGLLGLAKVRKTNS